jgi:zinc transport system substrate-binding protein
MNPTIVRRLLVALTLPVLLVIVACSSDDPSPTSTLAPEPSQAAALAPEPSQASTPTPEPELDVITTLYAVTYFSERVGGERAQVESLIKAGVDAHAFEPVASDVIAIGEADVLVFNHPAFESWVVDAINAANSQSLVVVKTADLPDDIKIAHDHGDEHDEHGDEHDEHGNKEAELVKALAHVIHEVEDGDITAAQGFVEIEEVLHEVEGDHEAEGHADHQDETGEEAHLEELIHELEEIIAEVESGAATQDEGLERLESVLGEHDHEGDEHADHDDDEHADKEDEHGHDLGMDPHVWLSPLEAIKQVRAIQDAFSTADPEGADLYAQNANTLVDELRSLDAEFSAALSSCSLDHMIVSHEAYGHLAAAYGIEQIGLKGLSTEGEATPQRVAQIVDKITELGVQHLLQEPITGSPLVETVAVETGSEILPLHPMESLTPAELDGGATYFTIMNENLRSLRVALGCS